jgi:hypothetical protein
MAIDKDIFWQKINEFVAGKLQNKTAAASLAVYSSQDPDFEGVGQFTRNTACWLNGVKNISCFSPAQLSGSGWSQRGGTLITRKHALFARHFFPALLANGTPLLFVADDNTVVRRNIVQYALHDLTDIAIGLLDEEVPAGIQIAKVLPKNYADYFNFAPGSSPPIYVVGLDQEENALVKMTAGLINYMLSGSPPFKVIQVNETAAAHAFQTFNQTIVGGDSGNPLFMILDNELVVLTTWFTSINGPFITDRYDDVNALIENLSPGGNYALTAVDLAVIYETMQKRYFSPGANDEWTTLGNWYQDATLSVPALNLPGSRDIPVLPWSNSGARAVGGPAILSAL